MRPPGRPKGEYRSAPHEGTPVTLPGEAVVASPCNNVCKVDARTGWCEGCLRTLDEIASWSVLDDSAKRAVWVALEQRRAAQRTSGPTPRPEAA